MGWLFRFLDADWDGDALDAAASRKELDFYFERELLGSGVLSVAAGCEEDNRAERRFSDLAGVWTSSTSRFLFLVAGTLFGSSADCCESACGLSL